MSRMRDKFNDGGIIVAYKKLGTISIDELAHAILEDIQALKDLYQIQFVQGASLKIFATNEYGDPVRIQHPQGGHVSYIDTHHFRPACLDYKL